MTFDEFRALSRDERSAAIRTAASNRHAEAIRLAAARQEWDLADQALDLAHAIERMLWAYEEALRVTGVVMPTGRLWWAKSGERWNCLVGSTLVASLSRVNTTDGMPSSDPSGQWQVHLLDMTTDSCWYTLGNRDSVQDAMRFVEDRFAEQIEPVPADQFVAAEPLDPGDPIYRDAKGYLRRQWPEE